MMMEDTDGDVPRSPPAGVSAKPFLKRKSKAVKIVNNKLPDFSNVRPRTNSHSHGGKPPARGEERGLSPPLSPGRAATGPDLAVEYVRNELRRRHVTVADFMRDADVDRNDAITTRELEAGLKNVGLRLEPTVLRDLFQLFDLDRSGRIGYAELHAVLGERQAKAQGLPRHDRSPPPRSPPRSPPRGNKSPNRSLKQPGKSSPAAAAVAGPAGGIGAAELEDLQSLYADMYGYGEIDEGRSMEEEQLVESWFERDARSRIPQLSGGSAFFR